MPDAGRKPPPEFYKALEEFNQRRFFECHETLEDLWNAERSELRRFYQGILQVGVAYYKVITRPNYRGALSLFESGVDYLRAFQPETFGLDVSKLIESAESSRRELEKLGPTGLNQFDRQLIPVLEAGVHQMDYNEIRNNRPSIIGDALQVAGKAFNSLDEIDCGEIGKVSGQAIMQAGRRYDDLTRGGCHPQLATLVFDVTGDFRALDFYFPIVNSLKHDESAREDFYNAVRYIAAHPGLDTRVYAENRQDVTAETPPAVRHIVAGHLAEVFFYRRDIIERFLSQPRHFLIYINRRAFDQDGGLAGGDYNFDREAIQLEMSRLFEGYNGKTPGVAPFLHELGHMLDHFEAGTGGMGRCEGVLPGMTGRDGAVFTPVARQLFIAGKQLEQQRYISFQNGYASPNDPVPVGHPYVFQTDGEFIAGFLEMFFRNPNYFASQNPQLYQAFAEVLHQDPRRYWPEDFPFYVSENRKAYVGGQRPHPQNISIPRP